MYSILMILIIVYVLRQFGIIEWLFEPSWNIKDIKREIEWDKKNKAKLSEELKKIC